MHPIDLSSIELHLQGLTDGQKTDFRKPELWTHLASSLPDDPVAARQYVVLVADLSSLHGHATLKSAIPTHYAAALHDKIEGLFLLPLPRTAFLNKVLDSELTFPEPLHASDVIAVFVLADDPCIATASWQKEEVG